MVNSKNLKIGIIVNDIENTLDIQESTILGIAVECLKRGHKVWFMSIDSLAYDSDEMVYANAVCVPENGHDSIESYFEALKLASKEKSARICVSTLDILLLRNDPSLEPPERSWARTIALDFGTLATKDGVIVLNHPGGLSNSRNKLYMQNFPVKVRPKTIITRDREEMKKFFKNNRKAVFKPLSGSEGRNVFLAHKNELSNINQMIDAVSRDGYVIAQEYLSESENGDIRLFLMNGEPLYFKGQYAAFKRVKKGGDLRNNISAGGKPKRAKINKDILEICNIVRPILIQDGMFLVGLDIVGKKILEANVFCPGGFGNIQKVTGVNFAIPVVDALERKVEYRNDYKSKFDNNEIATL
jgi:glutathione synthase